MTFRDLATDIHPFERAGLGRAPFRLLGLKYQQIAYGQRVLGNGCTTKPGGTCAYCGTYIVNMFCVESADGQRFHVGCDCMRTIDDPAVTEPAEKLIAQAKREERQRKADERRAREGAQWDNEGKPRCEAALARLVADEALRAKLEALPHPKMADRPEYSLLSYLEFCLQFAGRSGMLDAAKTVEKFQAGS